MKATKFLLFFLIAIALVGSASAFFPVYHYDVTKRACESYHGTNSLAVTCCSPQYVKYVEAGANLADITVVKYLQQLGAYDATHSWDYCKALANDPGPIEEQCFALGNCLHLIEDTPSHNDMVPTAIKSVLVPNLLIHAPSEYKFDRWARANGADYSGMESSLEVARCNRDNPSEPNYDPTGISTKQCRLVHKMQIALASTKEGGTVDAYSLTHWYIKSVVTDAEANNGVYTAGTNAYLAAIPFSYKSAMVIVLLFFTAAGISMVRMKKKGKFVKVFLGLAVLAWVFTAVLLVAIMSNQIYTFFLAVIYPISAITPTGNFAMYDSTIIQNIHTFLDGGTQSIPSLIQSGCSSPPCIPSGFNGGGIERTDTWVSIVWVFLLVIMLAVFIYMTAKTLGFDILNWKRRRGR